MNCPLCNSQNIKVVEELNSSDIVDLYNKMTKKDFSYLLNVNIKFCECQECSLNFYSPMIVGDEKFYNSLQTFDWYYVKDKIEYQKASEYISEKDLVLEVGSGKGTFSKYISAGNYIGLDFSEKAKKLAYENGVVVENISIVDYANQKPESFDVVCSFQVLEHVANTSEFIEAKVKALKKGGTLIIAVPSEDSFVGNTVNSTLNMPPHHVTRWKDVTLKYIANKYNLKLLKIHHEKVQDIHLNWYLSSKFQNLFLKHKNIDRSFKRNLISKLSVVYAFIKSKFINKKKLPAGHTVLAIYEKL